MGDERDLAEWGERLVTAEAIAAAVGIPVPEAQLWLLMDSLARFYAASDGAVEQRSGMSDSFGAITCRWETVDGLRYQVVYDRDGQEDTRMLLLGSGSGA